MTRRLYLLMLFLFSITISAQEYFPKNDGVKTTNNHYTAFTNAKIYVSPTQIIENGTLLIKDGKVVATGKSVAIPKNSIVIDASNKSIYPSFIDVFSDFGISKPERISGRGAQYDASREGFYWNDHIRPDQNAIDFYKYDEKSASDLRKAGFGVVNTHLQDGIIRGTGTLIALTPNSTDASRILENKSAQYYSTRKSVQSRQSYPNSLMGTMALLRQVHYDAKWYANGNVNNKDRALEAYNTNKSLVQIMDAGSKINALRFAKVGKETNTEFVFVGGGDEYENIIEIKATNASFIIPLNFPDAFDVSDPFLAEGAGIADLRAWNQKPANPKILAENNVPFSFTLKGLDAAKDLMPNLQKAIQYGLGKTKALEALTTTPAKILGKENSIGSLKNGAYANFLITSGDVFDKNTILYQNWVNGEKHEIHPMSTKDIRGDYNFTLAGETYDLKISGDIAKPKASVSSKDKKLGTILSFKDDWLNISFTSTDTTSKNLTRLVSKISNPKILSGKAILPNGNETSFYAKRAESKEVSEEDKKEEKDTPKVFPITYPNEAYGFKTLPQQETILFKNATVWTNEAEGILEQTDVLVKDGKIAKIGNNLKHGNAKIVDATGKHLTTGIIDEHSHIATSAVNESGQNSSAEVSIEDVIDAEDVDIYRNLAGGVTSIQVLHGSANPIGGRSAIIKLKWGETADNLIYKNSPKFIKFALGENVKQSNWSSFNRFPQTRMGVEQMFIDYFTRAQEYIAKKKSGKPYRKDVELEVLAEILNEERFISCHSYVQSEINMLMKVAEKFNFKVNTFTHILEGYKLADKMKEHGAGGSTFSDWWAYKYEVNDAIPQNAAIMHNNGVTVAINSDDAEMSRRLNQEAAKSIKYGGVSEEDAWKFITLNPAKLLHIDDRVGSIKVGKDADLVLWSDHPLSIYAKAEKTIIEGVTYFDIERDLQLRKEMKAEKNELLNRMLQAKNKGLKTIPIKKKGNETFHCDTEAEHIH
ncbi:amidohydrolase family protein [Oceanihabitans sediminis]|uniref:Amidohydrolase n=1 Tax=Oceanihabitans sediminis TaxID=1812012 RepID=A0A368P407_9FLAO|nr:amidohydrolase family protein [Oceanihabitans sediminis]MDX1277970.1 amidohydrolase family protein [Oceanihabitans sediminis]MDX1774121.1 amidohydrolase family protein [Oceanihabitans sediminis]RBP30838.1 imidazolonepropionase-like amidohydrolase [Oceanihabitans sediminis]RCU56804.1 amidohydrolase [Oceanihabitans sediminis]